MSPTRPLRSQAGQAGAKQEPSRPSKPRLARQATNGLTFPGRGRLGFVRDSAQISVIFCLRVGSLVCRVLCRRWLRSWEGGRWRPGPGLSFCRRRRDGGRDGGSAVWARSGTNSGVRMSRACPLMERTNPSAPQSLTLQRPVLCTYIQAWPRWKLQGRKANDHNLPALPCPALQTPRCVPP